MTILTAFFATLGQIQPITASANWGSGTEAIPTDITLPDRTLTVIAPNPGDITIDCTLAIGGGNSQYRVNSGSWTNIISLSASINISNGDTLGLRVEAPSAAAATDFTVSDDTTGATIGTGTTTPTEP